MSKLQTIPFEHRSLSAAEAGELLGYVATYVRDHLAYTPGFPKRADNDGHPRWVAGELLEWREANQASRQARRRKSGNKSTDSSGHGVR